MSLPPDFVPEEIPLVPEDDPMNAFALETDDLVDTPALPSLKGAFRTAPPESSPLVFASTKHWKHRVSTLSALGAVLVLAAAGAYLSLSQRVSPNEPIDARHNSAPVDRTEAAPAIASGVVSPVPPSSPLSGEWIMNTRVESSDLQRYQGLRLGYRIRLQQDGERVSGRGWKVSEDERPIASRGQTPIDFDGVVNGHRVELTFTERGRRRVSAGKLVLALASEDILKGRFSSDAARSGGIVEIHR